MASLKLSALLLVLALGCALASRREDEPDVRAYAMKDHHHYDHPTYTVNPPPQHDDYPNYSGYSHHHDDHHHESKCSNSCDGCPKNTPNFCDGQCVANSVTNCGACGIVCDTNQKCREFPAKIEDAFPFLSPGEFKGLFTAASVAPNFDDVINAVADFKNPKCPKDKRSQALCCLDKDAVCVNTGAGPNAPCCPGYSCETIPMMGKRCVLSYKA